MGKFVGLVGALTTFGAVAYLMTPLPPPDPLASSLTTPATSTRSSAPGVQVAIPPSPAAPVPAARSQPTAPRAEPTLMLIQQIQAELQRLGCYSGAIDGQWSDATQRAMQTLGERVSVLRPVDTPDYIMLALARGQANDVCAPKQRAATTGTVTKWTAIAAPVSSAPSTGEIKPTSNSTRVVASEPAKAQPGATPQATAVRTRADAPPKRPIVRRDATSPADATRAMAARDELDRINRRSRTTTAAVAPPTTATTPATTVAEPVTPSNRPPADPTRMGLGAAPVDPLNAGIDPRNPNAPAYLRGPPQPLPGFAALPPARPIATDTAPRPSRAAIPAPPASVAPPPARVASKQAKRAWQRSVFSDMRFNGP